MAEYDPKYISRDDIPISIPDDYSANEKSDALRYAEMSLEMDTNDGETIDDSNFTDAHFTAIQYKATCHLARGSEHPDDMTVSDLSDDGSTKVDYAESFCDDYEELVDDITSSKKGGTEGESGSGSPYHTATDKPDRFDESPNF